MFNGLTAKVQGSLRFMAHASSVSRIRHYRKACIANTQVWTRGTRASRSTAYAGASAHVGSLATIQSRLQ